MKAKNTKKNVLTLVECAVLIALSVVLSFLKIWKMPLGGSVTLLSMLPVCIIAIRHGLGWGFGSAFVYSLFQLIFGITMDGILGWGLNAPMLIGCMMFDYIIAFTVLGIAGAFRKKGTAGIYLGITLACVARFASHFLSGYVIFKNLEQWTLFGTVFSNRPILYSVCYNGLYMLPELALTLIATVILMRVTVVREKIMTPQ